MIETFRDLGRDMFLTGLVSSHTGTMSVRTNGMMTMSRRGAMLGRLAAEDLIEFDVDGDAPEDAPDDAIVHQAIYRGTDALAVIYARPPATMALALVEDRLSPANGEGAEMLGSAPVLISQRAITSSDVAQLVARTLRENRVAALRGQGVFARGADLKDALHMVSLLDEMCRVVQIFRTLSREEAQPAAREWHERQNSLSPYRDRSKSDGAPGRRPPTHTAPSRGTNVGPRRGDGAGPRQPTDPRNGGGRRPRGPHR
ncbi:MAG TPA: class II aldolase/adducin family protein [Chloroflexota bacterium]|nr:class II aldolase/adducin family protein [Chloroflexota bacterium]